MLARRSCSPPRLPSTLRYRTGWYWPAPAYRFHPPRSPERGINEGVHGCLPSTRHPSAPRLHRTTPTNPRGGRIAFRIAEEWKEFEQHFLPRKVALGTCHRPYATPCTHEHACLKCRFLQIDPAQSGRLEDMTASAEDRLDEARQHQCLGEVSALEESLVHLRCRRDEMPAPPSRSLGSGPEGNASSIVVVIEGQGLPEPRRRQG